ncbi:MAG: phosphate acetyltransferase [Hyphomicrobiaceae bacterium]|nr:MAG: phosphate acetyltransferase [Hyphomicrobiaceae bacterium]
MRLGDRAEVARAFDAASVSAFCVLAGLKDGGCGGRLPEPLIAGLFSYLLGVKLPGQGTNYLKQELTFLAPARIGERLSAVVEITRLRPEKHLCDLTTTCSGADGRLICKGRALVLVRDVGRPMEA